MAPRKLITQLQKLSHLLKDELIACLQALSEDLGEKKDKSEDWIDAVDRSGLVHITHQIYRFFCAMECAYRAAIARQPENFKQAVRGRTLHDEDVLVHWPLLSANWEEEKKRALLPMIVDLWVTIRVFSNASAWNQHKVKRCKKRVNWMCKK